MTHRQIENAIRKLKAHRIAARIEQIGDYAALVISGADVALAMQLAPAIRTGFARAFGTTETAFVSTMTGRMLNNGTNR